MPETTYLAIPSDRAHGPGVLVLHAWWGLNTTFREICDRLAAGGFVALAPDLFGDGRVVTTPAEAEARVGATDFRAAAGRAGQGLDDLLAQPSVTPGPVGVVGFSFGAAYALALSQRRPEIAAVVAYYGTMSRGNFSGSRADYLGHYVPGDEWEPDVEVDGLERTIRTAGRDVTIHRYPTTRHWFVEPDRPEYDAASAELAWQRTIVFLRERLAGPSE